MISSESAAAGNTPERSPYQAPKLKVFGMVRDLTRNGTGSGNDGTTDNTMNKVSDPYFKENIVRVDTHPMGFGLYLFDYKPEFQAELGAARQFGVMADEVESVMPEAVSVAANGYRVVDYGKLGIVLH